MEEDEVESGTWKPLVSSSKARASRICRKEGKGLWWVNHVIVVVVTPQDIEHQDPVLHRVPEVTKSISLALHSPAELAYGEVTLLESAELCIELESSGLALERLPGLVRGAAVSPDHVLEIKGDGPKDPGHGNAVEAQPRHVPHRDWRVVEDMVVEGVAAKREENWSLHRA